MATTVKRRREIRAAFLELYCLLDFANRTAIFRVGDTLDSVWQHSDQAPNKTVACWLAQELLVFETNVSFFFLSSRVQGSVAFGGQG